MKISSLFLKKEQKHSGKISECKNHIYRYNYKAFLFLMVFLFDAFYPALASAASSQSHSQQDVPVAEKALEMVDLFTGDLNYSVPLMKVPGPNGENVDITAYYSAGISVQESASMLGLGWSLNTGEISRQVVGYPDDFAGQAVANLHSPANGYPDKVTNTRAYGPFYFNKINTASNYNHIIPGTHPEKYSTDNLVVESEINGVNSNGKTYLNIVNGFSENGTPGNPVPRYFAKPTAPFAMPAYDNYFVSGNGISGKIRPYIFSTPKSGYKQDHPVLYASTGPKSDIRQNRKVEFYFEGSSYGSASNLPNNITTNRLTSSYYVKYYTNAEINNSSNLFNNSTYLGFLDYRVISSTRRPNSQFDANAIGGIQITNSDGFTYHYSLPVYVNSCTDKSFSASEVTLVHKPAYVTSWKLTAITGPDYKDLNNNKVVDLGDMGYWVQYKYGLWSNDFYESSLLYGRQNKKTGRISSDYSGGFKYTAGNFNLNETKSQKYYLDYIRTSTHTAYFIKDIRLDEHSAEIGQAPKIGELPRNKVNPSLRLSKIILLKNENKELMENTNYMSTAGLSSNFNKALLSSPIDPTLIHTNTYNHKKAWVDKASLKSIEFIQDYSLCKKYYSNINSSFGTLTYAVQQINPNQGITVSDFKKINNGSSVLYTSVNPNNFPMSDLANSGKLTLNQIRMYEDGAVELFNPYKFDYRQNNANKNPDYDPVKKDIWGYYKSDHSGLETNTGYPTCESALHVDAWSLWKITLPEGATIEMEYESDTYSSEGFQNRVLRNRPVFGDDQTADAAQNSLRRPHYIYPIASVNQSTGGLPYVTAWENDDKSYVEAHVFVASSTTSPNQCENRGAGLFYAVPIPTSYNPKKIGGYQLPYVTEVPEFFIGWNGQSAGAASPHNGRWPDYGTYYSDPYGAVTYQPYLKNKWYGYELQAATWLFGGGVRVKSITFKELESGVSFIKEFNYEGGYCPAPPKPHILGLAGGNTFYTLWTNTFNFIPYVNLTNVGYTKVETRNRNMFSESNGYTATYFKNAQFVRNPLTIKPDVEKVNIPNPSACNDQGITIYYLSGNHPVSYKNAYSYSLNATFSEDEYKNLGLIERIEQYNNTDTKPVYKKVFEYGSYSISEAFDISYLNTKKEVAKSTKQPFLAAQADQGDTPVINWVQTDCKEEERYCHFANYVSVGKYLTKEYETIDDVTTTSSYEYDWKTTILTGVTKTSPTDGQQKVLYEYAYQNPVHPLGLKCDQESKLNKLHELVAVRKYKGGFATQSLGDFILTEETVSDQWNYRTLIREFNPTSTQTSPQGCYYVNTNSAFQTNDIIPYEQYDALLNNNTAGNSALSFPNNHRLNGRPTLFSKNGKTLESYGLNNRYSAVKMGYNDIFPLASIQNARYSSFGFTSFEDTLTVAPGVLHFGGEFTKGSTRKSIPGIIKPHTGLYVSEVAPQTTGPVLMCRLFDVGRTYEAKVWVHKSSPSNARLKINLKGVTIAQTPINTTVSVDKNNAANIQVGDWILMKCRIEVPQDVYVQNPYGYTLSPDLTVSVENPSSGTNAYFDDLMFAPIDAPITGSVFDLRTGRLIANLDDENFASYFNYDAAGRVVSIYKETKLHGVVKVSEREYNNCRSTQNISNGGAVTPHIPN